MSETRDLDEMLGRYLDTRDLLDRADALDIEDEDDREEAERIEAILSDLEDTFGDAVRNKDWGVILIPEPMFEDHAQELADDIGAINSEQSWPACHIDWEAAAASLAQDYSMVTIEGTDYLGRE